ncbi:MAG TPA: hypothetical protein VH327_00210 [Gammaproteobacteria bacterium]|jgi:hypothetical protein|nr:hypothetical protein [Gammaproteobacteria bacterium]
MDLAFLFLMILLAWAVWAGISNLISGDFALTLFMAWLIALASAGWLSRDQLRVLRIPAGLLVFLIMAAVLLPLSLWSSSKLAVGAEAAVAAVSAWYLGERWSKALAPRVAAGVPWYLDQSINLVEDLFRWIGACVVAWVLVGLLPLLFVLVMPLQWVPWVAMGWGLGLLVWYCYKFRPSRVRFLKIPLGLWVFAVAALVLQLFEKQIMGSMEEGSIGLIAYAAYAPGACALFVEIIVRGTRKAAS